MEGKSSTKSFIAKTIDEVKKENRETLLNLFPNAKKCKFKNCIKLNIDRICVKIYTNFTLQFNGIKNISDLENILKEYFPSYRYRITCVLSNWIVNISENNKEINLLSTIDILNSKQILSYFLRGKPLIIKTQQHVIDFPVYIFSNKKLKLLENIEKDVNISVLMYKSGSCIFSSCYEKPVTVCYEKIKNNLIYEY